MNKPGWNNVGPKHPATQQALSDSEAFRAAPCSPIFHDAPETAMYVAKNYNVRMFDAMMCFQKMAELERQRNIAVAALKSLASQSGHKSAPGCNCMDCQYIRPIEYAIRDATCPTNVERTRGANLIQP